VGASLQRVESQLPASKTESANALTAALRYRLRLETSSLRHAIDASYSLRSANRVLNSDFVYARQRWELRYMMTHGKTVVIEDLSAGLISGRAPLFERFVLGNSRTLRGWNKYELDPLGGNRVVHNSFEYRYGALQAFYDSGAVWDRGSRTVVRHSVGFGLRQGQFLVAIAFPVREGHLEPIFIAGLNY
jgi:outer membrane translocation and assembly module TamA